MRTKELQKILRRIFTRGDVPDDEVIEAIRAVPTHYSASRIQQDESLAPWQFPDPFPGNTTVGAGMLPFTFNSQLALSEVNASTAEVRTMPDPLKAYTSIGMTLVARNGQNLVVRFNTPVWLGATVTQPSLTQNGQFVTFTATNHSIQIVSVPCTKTQFVGTQATITNTTGFRWMLLQSDGPALS